MFLQGGIYMLELVDYSISGFPLLIIGLLECTALCWIYGYDNFAEDIALMIGKRPGIYWHACWKYVTPGIVLVSSLTFVIYDLLYPPKRWILWIWPEYAAAAAATAAVW